MSQCELTDVGFVLEQPGIQVFDLQSIQAATLKRSLPWENREENDTINRRFVFFSSSFRKRRPMTTLRIQTDCTPLTISFPALMQMTNEGDVQL